MIFTCSKLWNSRGRMSISSMKTRPVSWPTRPSTVSRRKRYGFTGIDRGALAGPAEEYRIQGAAGTIGTITPVTGHFCEGCNRIRVTASGMARGCLFSEAETELKPILRGNDPSELENVLVRIVGAKPGKHRLCEEPSGPSPLDMSRVGG
jgi:cyclic pyranopterin phosphate synthase